MRLRRRFLVAFLVLAVVLSALSLAGFTLYRNATVDQEQAALDQVSQTIASQVDVVLTEKRQTVRLWAQTPSLEDHGSQAQASDVRTFVTSTAFSGASVIAANGTMTAFYSRGTNESRSAALVGRSFDERTYFTEAMAGESYVSDPVAAESGYLIVTISTPIRSAGRVVGTFNAAFHVREGDLFGPIRARDAGSQGVLVVADGQTMYADGPRPTTDRTLAVANATVEQTGWTVSVTRTDAAVRSQLRSITLLQLGTLALALGALSLFGWWLYREYVANFERLQNGFAALVAGKYGTTVSLSGPTEWTTVAADFNELSETLARRRVEVTVLNRVLRHNLRNAMTVVSGTAARIEETTDDERLAKDAGMIKRRGESLLALADHARVVESSLQVDRTESPPRPIGAIVDESVAGLREEYPHATVQTDSVPDETLVPDGDLLAVVVDELVRNAIIHGNAEPTVMIDVAATDETVILTISDDGPGLPEIEQRLLTEQFVETPTDHGSGLGLWVVKWIVEWLDGSVAVTADDGTLVSVTLPRVSDEE